MFDDETTKENINRRVNATTKQNIVESHSSLKVDEPVFKTLKLKIK